MTANNVYIPSFRVGYDTYDQPEVMPNDAFPQLEDALCFRGVLKKRDGYINLIQPINFTVNAMTNVAGSLITLASNHYFVPGDSVIFINCQGVYAGFNRTVFNIVTTPALNTFTIDNTIAPGIYVPATGTVSRYPFVGTIGIANVAAGAVTTITTIAALHHLTSNQTVFIGNVEGSIGLINNSVTQWPVNSIANTVNSLITTGTQHGYAVGDQVIFKNCSGMVDGFNNATFTITAIPAGNQFVIDNGFIPGVYTANSGTVQRTVQLFGYPITVTGANTFTIPVNTIGLAYVRGGTIHQPIMGLNNQLTAGLFENLIAMNESRAFLFVSGIGDFIDISGATVWTGNDSQFFWSTNYFGSFWTTNNFDPIRYFITGTTWTNFNPQLDAAGTTLASTLMLFPYKNRLVALNTQEGAAPTNFPQRARWSALGTPYVAAPTPAGIGTNANAWRSDIVGQGGFIDAPTQEKIVSAQFVKDTLVVFFERSTWRLRYTGNNLLPFVWERINSQLGSECTYSQVGFDEGVIAIGRQGIVVSDMNSSARIDDKIIPDQFTDIEFGELNGQRRVQGIRDMERLLVYWTYPSNNQPFPDKILCYNYIDKNFSVFNDQFTTFGYFRDDADLTWGSDDNAWEDEERFWNAGNLQRGFPIVVAGNRLGEVWQIQAVNSEVDNAFNWNALTKKFNPFVQAGMQAKAIYLHILCAGNTGGEFEVLHYIDENSSVPIETLTIPTNTNGQEKVWRRIALSGTGQWHQFRFQFSDSQLIDDAIPFEDYAIYQILLEMEPAGRLSYGDFTT